MWVWGCGGGGHERRGVVVYSSLSFVGFVRKGNGCEVFGLFLLLFWGVGFYFV